MDKKIWIAIAVVAVTLATVKTGYAFYERQNNQTEEKGIVYAKQIDVGGQEEGNIQTDISYVTEDTKEDTNTDSTDESSSSSCCSGPYGNMFDDNGNLKDRDTYEKELDAYIESGELTEGDKEYYLFMYDKCQSANSGDTNYSQEGSSSSSFSCH